MTRSPDTLARYLKGIGPKRAKNLGKLGINSIEDILYYFPRRYEDRTNFTPIAGLKEGEVQTVSAKVLASSGRRSYYRRGLSIIEATVADGSGKLFCVWFNQPYLKGYLKAGTRLILYGKTERYSGRLQMSAPEFEIVSEDDDGSLDIGRITPVYSLPKGISQRYFRKVVKQALDEYLPGIKDFLSYGIRSKHSLLNAAKALFNIHFPEGPEIQRESYRRLSFEEFFIFQVPLALRKLRRKEKQGIAHRVDSGVTEAFFDSLPFVLTEAQKRAFTEIKKDMGSREPMQRLLQGDVGSGKTIVALASTLIAVGGGYQTAFMVPTEILAKQHFETVTRQIQKIRVLLLTSSLDRKAKEKAYLQIREGRSDLVIGTHALLEEGLNFKNLGLVVIDEQHKFGVGQRALLPRKGVNPDCLIMTATPIPRTLAITLYGDLDISVIDELPKGRIPVETTHFKEEDNAGAYGIARQELAKGHQVYCVYPVIEDSYALDIVGAEKMYEELEKKEFRDYRVGLIHGRLKQEDQDKAMQRFKDRELDVLVSTTVLEVGIDIPNATCMIIEHAERFGLSQLHQLRGRIGRASLESFCLLISDLETPQAKARIEAMTRFNDGFRIAEEDLKIRGPGEFFGSRQHGLSELKIANPLTQMHLLKAAREEAVKLVASDTRLTAKENLALKERLLKRFPEYERLMLVG